MDSCTNFLLSTSDLVGWEISSSWFISSNLVMLQWTLPLVSENSCSPRWIGSSSRASKSKLDFSESAQTRQTCLRPGKVAFSGSDENFILGTPLIWVNLQTRPRAGCFLQVAILVPTAQTSISLWLFSISISRYSFRSSEAKMRSLCSLIYWSQILRHCLDSSQRSPESSRMPMSQTPASIRAFPTMIVFLIPDSNVLQVSIRVLKL